MLTKSMFGGGRAGMARLGLAALVAFLACRSDAQAIATWFGAWDYVLQHDSDAQPQAAFARLQGEDGALLWLTCQKQILAEDQPPVPFITAAVRQRQYLGRSGPRGRSTVYWFDGGTPEVGHWIYRDRHVQIPDRKEVDAFVDKLAGARSLTVELSNYRYETTTFEFRLNAADTRNLAERFRKDCDSIFGGRRG